MPSSTNQVSWVAEANRSANDSTGRVAHSEASASRTGASAGQSTSVGSTSPSSGGVVGDRGPDQVRRRLERLFRPSVSAPAAVTTSVACSTNEARLRPCLVGLGPVAAQAERVRAVLVGGTVGRDRDHGVRGVGDVRRVLVVDVAEQVVLLGQAQQRLDAGFADRALLDVRQERARIDLDLRALLRSRGRRRSRAAIGRSTKS